MIMIMIMIMNMIIHNLFIIYDSINLLTVHSNAFQQHLNTKEDKLFITRKTKKRINLPKQLQWSQ